jgi:hypothetical protein
MIPFKVQFDKLTEAYIRGKVNPYDECSCFVGNLLNNRRGWGNVRYVIGTARSSLLSLTEHETMELKLGMEVIAAESDGMYTDLEIVQLENMFMRTFAEHRGSVIRRLYVGVHTFANGEEALFIAFEKTLELLKRIHESKGEVVDVHEFKRRPTRQMIPET